MPEHLGESRSDAARSMTFETLSRRDKGSYLEVVAPAMGAALVGSLVPSFRAARPPIVDALGNTR